MVDAAFGVPATFEPHNDAIAPAEEDVSCYSMSKASEDLAGYAGG